MTCPRCHANATFRHGMLYCLNCGGIPTIREQEEINGNREHAEQYAGDTRKFRGGFGAGSAASPGEDMGRTPHGEWWAYLPEIPSQPITNQSPDSGTTVHGRWNVRPAVTEGVLPTAHPGNETSTSPLHMHPAHTADDMAGKDLHPPIRHPDGGTHTGANRG